MDFRDLSEKAKGAKMLILCSPHNPVGRVWDRQELLKLAQICIENNLLIFSDEIHCDIILGEKKHTAIALLEKELGKDFLNRLVVGTAASKTFSLAGLSTSGIIIPNPVLRDAFQKTQEKNGAGFNNSFGRAATIAAYNEGGPWLNALIEYLKGNIKLCKEYFSSTFPDVKIYETEGSYLLWADVSSMGSGLDGILDKMKKEARVFVSDGRGFGAGGDGFVRINVACPRSALEKAFNRLSEVF